MPMFRRDCAILLVILASACGGSTPNPTAPPTPTLTGLTISGPDAIIIGFVSNYMVTAALSNGTSQAVTPTWTSDNSSVATIAPNGDLTGVSNGTTNIIAT